MYKIIGKKLRLSVGFFFYFRCNCILIFGKKFINIDRIVLEKF